MDENISNIKIISRHRSELMLLSILWVITFHFTPPHYSVDYQLIGWWYSFKMLGYAGVDFFMFLSGFGLTYSYWNRKELKSSEFCKKRLVRILPTYFVCILVFGLIQHLSINDMLWQFSCIGFWIGRPYYDWYIQAILILYLTFPLFLTISRKYGIEKIALIGCVIGLMATATLVYLWKGTPILFFARMPIFFIGCYYGYLLVNDKVIKHPRVWIAMAIVGFITELLLTMTYDVEFLHKSALNTLPFILIVPGVSLLLSRLFDLIPVGVLKPFQYFGKMTLEIYLCHMSLRFICPSIHYLLPICCGVVLHYFIKYATCLINKNKK